MRFFHRKKRGDAGPVPGSAEFMAVLAGGHVPCQSCGCELPLKRLEPLRMVRCPKCEAINFVPLRIKSFWLFEPLGGGAMGSVYKACSSEHPDEFFAIKVLPRGGRDRPALVQALVNESMIAKAFGEHPCLVKWIDSGFEDGEYFCALAYVEGERLDKRIDSKGRLQEKYVLPLALHILSAEQHIYDCGYLYRDLKPENIIVNTQGYAVLLDYGLCMPREEALHPGDEFVSGSPYYLPPERLLGTGEDMYSEIYSLGMVMYYALSGQTYFDAEEVETLAKRHVAKARLSASSKMRNFRPELVELLSRMVKQDHTRRHQTFRDVALDIRRVFESLSTDT